MHKRLILLSVLFLGACQGLPEFSEDSPYHMPPAGSLLSLHHELIIPAGTASTYLQNGKIGTFGSVDHYRPHCKFEVRDLQNSAHTLMPDDFTITRIRQQHSTHTSNAPVRLAGLAGMHHGGGMMMTYATIMDLSSVRQPEALRLTCQHWEISAYPVHLTVRQIREALGPVFSLKITAAP